MKKHSLAESLSVCLIALSLFLAPVAPAFAQLTPPVTPPADTTPPVISGVLATSVSSVSESLVWTTNELAVSTFEYGTTMSYGSSSALSASAAIGGTATLTGLSPSTAYYYCIHATDTSGNSSQSCSSFTTAAAPVVILPPVISLNTVTSIATSSATLTWTTDTNSDTQVHYGTTSSYGSSSSLNSTLGLTHSATLSNLSPNTTYHYQVASRDASGNLTTSSDATFTTNSLPVVVISDTTPPVVSNIVASTVSSVAESIAWTTNELATSTIRWSTNTSYSSTLLIPETAGLTHTGALVGLSPSTTYNYCIDATDLSGNIASSCGHSFTTPAAPIIPDTTPPVITDVSGVSLEPHDATIIWTTDELATSQLEYGTTMSYGTFATLPTDALLSHSATLLGLQASTTYYYCIHATDLFTNTSSSCGSGNTFTTAAQQVTLDTTPPTVSLVTVAPIATSSASVTWTTDEVANGYVEYGTTDGYGSQTPLDTALSLTYNAPISGLTPNTVYHYRVVSSDEAGNTSITPDETFTTGALPAKVVVTPPADINPPSITNVTESSVGPRDATISWTTSELAHSTLEYGTTMSYGSSATLSGTAALVHDGTLADLSPNTTYYYCIHATDLASNTADSCGHSFTTGAPPLVLDTTPPALSLIAVASLATSSATVTWTTDKIAYFYVEYGTATSYGSQTPVTTNSSLSGMAALSNLSPDTTYHFRVHSSDSSGNTAVSSDETFTTDALSVVVVQTPSDTTPPVISGVAESLLLATSTTIVWTTNELATSTLEYGTTMSYGSQATIGTTALLAHTATILDLAPSTTYYYCITAADLAGNTANSCSHSFTTDTAPVVATPPIETPPATSGSSSETVSVTVPTVVISSVAADSVSETGATITWTTDVPADSRVEYGDSMEFDESTSDAALTTSHFATLTGLDPNTNYDFRVVSKPAGVGAVETTSNVYDFNTLAVPVVVDPAANILSVSASSVGETNASIAWTTDEGTSGSVEYGLTTAYGENTTPSTSLQTSGTVVLSPLLPDTTYHLRVKAVDAADNITYSSDHTFTTSVSVSAPNGSVTEVTASTTVEIATSTESTATSTENISAPVSEGSPNAAAVSGGGGGGSGSGGFSPSTPTPALITAAPADSQVVFMWNNPLTSNFAGTIVVRKQGSYPASPTDGTVIYQGNSSTFTDTNLQNGTTYYYTLYSYTFSGQYSNPLQISAAPSAGVNQVQLNENPILQPATSADHFSTDLQFGDKNLEVEHLQQILNTVNVHPSGLTTGYFGPLTEAALKTFQAKYNLPQTGIADAATRAILTSISQSWMIPNAPNGLADLTTDLKRGDQGLDVADLQKFLAYEGSYEEGIISGTYGPLTQESVADFQSKHGVTPVSGYVGYKTRHTIQTVLGL